MWRSYIIILNLSTSENAFTHRRHRVSSCHKEERWPSGRRRTLGKRVCWKQYRGFESLPLRQEVSYPLKVGGWLLGRGIENLLRSKGFGSSSERARQMLAFACICLRVSAECRLSEAKTIPSSPPNNETKTVLISLH